MLCGIPRAFLLRQIGVHVENMIIILPSIIDIFRGNLYDHLMSMRIKFAVIMNKIVKRAPLFMRTLDTTLMWIC